jgi:hypothetical protein
LSFFNGWDSRNFRVFERNFAYFFRQQIMAILPGSWRTPDDGNDETLPMRMKRGKSGHRLLQSLHTTTREGSFMKTRLTPIKTAIALALCGATLALPSQAAPQAAAAAPPRVPATISSPGPTATG